MNAWTPHHHPPGELLVDYVSGSSSEASSLLVASHLALCELCQERVAEMEARAGALLVSGPQAVLAPGAWERLLERIEAAPAPSLPDVPRVGPGPEGLPWPLLLYLDGEGEPPWRFTRRGVSTIELTVADARSRARLCRFEAGVPLDDLGVVLGAHAVVLGGALEAGAEERRRGDFCFLVPPRGAPAPRATSSAACVALVVDLPFHGSLPLGRVGVPGPEAHALA